MVVLASFCVYAQTETDIQLAQHYYLNGEFSKAQGYYEKLYLNAPTKVYFSRYLDCLINTGDKKGAEKLYKKQISIQPEDIALKIQFYFFYEQSNELDKAKKVKNDVAKQPLYDPKQVQDILSSLLAIDKYEWAMDIVDNAKKNLKYYPYEVWYAQIYLAQGKNLQAVEEYIKALQKKPDLKESIQIEIASRFDFSLENDEIKSVKNTFLSASQKDPNNLVYSEMLIWFFLQSRNFKAAFLQVSALERRVNGDGSFLIDFGSTCLENEEFTMAKDAFKEVIAANMLRRDDAQRMLLNTYFTSLTTDRNATKGELDEILSLYKTTLERIGNASTSVDMTLAYSEILAFYANRAEEARSVLETGLSRKGLTDIQKAKVKMKLADVLVLMDSIWDASILYMQIDSDFKFESIGNEAKFKNARVFYFDGEFDYAQAQLDVLKEATSKFISNDAMQLSLLILENYGLDSNYEAMSDYAKSELLIEQHRFSEAFIRLDSY
ncbi:MAG: hypothetical protein EBR91_08675 [Flavobacteriia bacterium]|nr:hypothetical protein [Flavobacteriia bacterium]